MKAEHLVNCLKEILLSAELPVPVCRAEEGIRFLCPPPQAPTPGAVFAGTLSEWNILCSAQMVYPKCTYLICTDGTATFPDSPKNCTYNLLILNASVKTTLHKLTTFLTKNTDFNDASQTLLYADFWQSIMSGSLSREQVTAYFEHFPFPVHPHLACIVITPDATDLNPFQIQAVQLALHHFFRDTNLFYINKEWIVLYSQKKDISVELDISYDAFSQLLERHSLNAGISYVCQLPEQFRTLYLTASASIKLGKNLNLKPYVKRIYTYYQYNTYYVIQLCSQKFREIYNTDNLIYLTHPDVTRLYYYDLENKTNLLDVLEAYLSHAQNLNLTAQALYMHRNTVLNKLNKIEEVLNHKPFTEKDHFLILLSCMIVKYQCSQKDITEFFP